MENIVLTKEWLKGNKWFVRATGDREANEIVQYLKDHYCVRKSTSDGDMRWYDGSIIGYDPTSKYCWFSGLGDEWFVNNITELVKQDMRKEVPVNDNSPLPFLKPFVRLVTQGCGTYIYQGKRENPSNPVYHNKHHAVCEGYGYAAWGDDLTRARADWDVVAIFDYPESPCLLLDFSEKGKLLWQREDQQLKALQQAVDEANKALESYKREKGLN